MKIRMLAGLILALSMGAASAASTEMCAGNAGPGIASVPADTTGASFVRVQMGVKCSANVQMAYDQDATKAVICSNSTKGKNNFGGSTAGGAVKPVAACAVANGACSKAPAVLANDGC